jgi:DeoR/GlpR family transcriptional regulator of sugar metabolism
MIKEDRLQFILDHLQDKQRVTLKELRDALKMSSSTIHRDVHELVKRGLVNKWHGGVVALANNQDMMLDLPIYQRLNKRADVKQRLAKAVVEHVPDGATVYISPGSTMVYVARELIAQKRFTLVTNAFLVAQEAFGKQHVDIIFLGGELHQDELAFSGLFMHQVLKQLQLDVALFSSASVDEQGNVCIAYLQILEGMQSALNKARQRLLIIDHRKLNRTSKVRVAGAADFDAVIINEHEDIPQDCLDNLMQQTEVILVP